MDIKEICKNNRQSVEDAIAKEEWRLVKFWLDTAEKRIEDLEAGSDSLMEVIKQGNCNIEKAEKRIAELEQEVERLKKEAYDEG